LILAAAGLLACFACAAGAPQAAIRTTQPSSPEAARKAAIAWLGKQVYAYQRATWRWERLMGRPLTPTAGRLLAQMSVRDVERTVTLWKRRAMRARRQATRPPHLAAFLCIHRYEASWTDAGSPYFGGLQMDLGFQAAYGGWLLRTKGTANHWTPLEQIWVAEKAAKSRGFYPWPNTARVCGLL
jgi:hypothetical protein